MSQREDVGAPGVQRNEHRAVFNFSKIMLEKLLKNTHKGGWQEIPAEDLYARVQEELVELEVALGKYLIVSRTAYTDPTEQRVKLEMTRHALARECADVANFCLMIADVAGSLEGEYAGLVEHLAAEEP